MPPRKPKEEGFKTPWGIISYRTFLILCLGSLTPFGQWTLHKAFGLQMPATDLEAVKIQTVEHGKQLATINDKLTQLERQIDRRTVVGPRPEFRIASDSQK